jgi:hypothetical protein
MPHDETLKNLIADGRKIALKAEVGDEDLGPFAQLPGTWANEPELPGAGFNMISLPFAPEDGALDYRLLVNRYNETLEFDLVDKAVANRGIERGDSLTETDQFVVTLDYMQSVVQVAAADFPESGLAGESGLGIHREPGLWLHMKNHCIDGMDIARLSTVPHGDSVLALGSSRVIDGPPGIPAVDALVQGATTDLEHPYMSPYKHFHDNPFEGQFDPLKPQAVLEQANAAVEIVRTIELSVDTQASTGGISNTPFVNKQANASQMQSIFWIQELAEQDEQGRPKMRLQYLQIVGLDFFPRKDGKEGLMIWPHISLNTLVRQ